MPEQITSGLPCHIEAGNTEEFSESSSTYPPGDGWDLTLFLSRDGVKAAEVEAVVDGDLWIVTIDPDDTAELMPGIYDFVEYVEKAGVRKTHKRGTVNLLENFAIDRPRTDAEVMLANINATIKILMTGEFKRTNFNQQEYEEKDLPALRTWRNALRGEVAAERARNGGRANWKTIKTRF